MKYLDYLMGKYVLENLTIAGFIESREAEGESTYNILNDFWSPNNRKENKEGFVQGSL